MEMITAMNKREKLEKRLNELIIERDGKIRASGYFQLDHLETLKRIQKGSAESGIQNGLEKMAAEEANKVQVKIDKIEKELEGIG